jgi:hypothetical protein
MHKRADTTKEQIATLNSVGKLREKLRRIPWKKIAAGLGITALAVLFFVGGHLLMNWYLQRGSGTSKSEYADWQAYSSGAYGFGFRYPNDWEMVEASPAFIVFKPKADTSSDAVTGEDGGETEEAEGGEEAVEEIKEYISLAIASNESRAKTSCEGDQSLCSFYANGIFGERTSTPETETVFFSHGEEDFTLTLYRYPSTSSGQASDERWQGYVEIFEEMAASFRFTTQTTLACEEDGDCALGIRLDECCTCAEAFTSSEIEANAAIAPYEEGKDYSGEKAIDCTGIYCSACASEPSGAVCVSNRCQIEE